jgi:hypothetical protein
VKRSIAEILTSRFGPALLEGFGVPVDNTITRVGMEDERADADVKTREDMWWNQFEKRPASVKRSK